MKPKPGDLLVVSIHDASKRLWYVTAQAEYGFVGISSRNDRGGWDESCCHEADLDPVTWTFSGPVHSRTLNPIYLGYTEEAKGFGRAMAGNYVQALKAYGIIP